MAEPVQRNWQFVVWAVTERLLPADCRFDPELGRRGRLIARFGFLGFLFGMLFLVFYALIGHDYGARIVLVCSVGFLLAPFLMKLTGSLNFAGNLLAGIMAAGFTALCGVEGGLDGHAIAWLVSVPLCALLLVGRRAARWWVIVCFLSASGVFAVKLAGVDLPNLYDPKWHSLISVTGYLALILFMFLLGIVFEDGRETAYRRMQVALTKLATSNDRLTRLNQEKTEFLGIAAHDLKNPLTTIVGYAELLRRGVEPDRIQKLADNIHGAGTRMRDLINNLLDANAIEEGRFTSRVEKCDLSELATHSVEHNQISATRKNIAIHVTAPPGLWIKADPAAAMQILDNLISNALKYAPPGTKVQINTDSNAGTVFLAVKDEGPGLSEEDQRKLFGRFVRLSAKPTGGESSNGLGLSIVKRLAQAMGGSVTCQSVLGEGAVFTVHFPQWTETAARAA